MKAILTKIVVCIVLLAAIGGTGYWFITKQINQYKDEISTKLEQEQLLNQRISDIQAKLDSSESQNQSLLEQIDNMLTKEEFVFDAGTIREEIKGIGELATLEYRYTNVATLDASKKLFDTDFILPGTSKTAIIIMDGVLKAGINVEKISIRSDESTKTITVVLPSASILSNELDEDSMQVYDETNGIFNPISLEDSRNLRNEIKNKAESKAIDNGVLIDAEQKAAQIIRCIIESVPGVKDTYTITFRHKS